MSSRSSQFHAYTSASEYLGHKTDRPLDGRATRLQRRTPESIAVRYQSTDVVTYHADGRIVLDSGGWQTPTTKDRINTYTRARIYQNKGQWYLGEPVSLFYDGMVIGADGQPAEPKQLTLTETARKRALDRAVSAYIKGFAARVEAGELEQPGPGDCWGCLMTVKDAPEVHQGVMRRERPTPHGRVEPMGLGHYLEHIGLGDDPSEVYYVPSLLWNAILSRGYAKPEYTWWMIQTRKDGGMAARILRGYFKDLKPALLAEWAGGAK